MPVIDNSHPIIDCRPLTDYQQGHIAGATHLPANALFQRMHELPQKNVELSLCGDPVALSQARCLLQEKGYKVAGEYTWNVSFLQALKDSKLLEYGDHSRQLWQPAGIIKRFVEQQPEFGYSTGQGLDIACGSGRDMVFLAQQGWQMTGIDYLPGALQRAENLAQHHHVTINTCQRDLETAAQPFPDTMINHYDLICVLRYLHRPLFPAIKALLKPGGIILYQTFMQGCEKISSPRNPNFLLAPNELAQHFSDFKILQDEVELLSDQRPVSAFIARKPS